MYTVKIEFYCFITEISCVFNMQKKVILQKLHENMAILLCIKFYFTFFWLPAAGIGQVFYSVSINIVVILKR